MLEMKIGVKTVDLPYSVRLYGVAEDLFDEFNRRRHQSGVD
jgi:hypothetical protein